MNSEIKRLQNEIQKLRKQNLEKLKQIKYIPLNIISNNLYINNNALNNKSPIKAQYYKNNSRYKNQNLNNSSLSINFKNKKNKSYNKLPFKQGMFSYKNSIISSSSSNNNYKKNNNYNYNHNSSNKINIKYNNNSSLLSANLKLNLDNDDIHNNNISQNSIIQGRIPSSSSFDLNKYKIYDKTIVNLKINKQNISNKNFIRSIIPKSPFKIVNSDNNGIQHKKTYNKKINNVLFNNPNSNKQILIRNSMDTGKISPIFPKMIPIKGQNSPPLLVIDDYKDNNLNSSRNSIKKRKIVDHFRNCENYKKESRRMIIEYLKVLNRQNYNNKNMLGKTDIYMIMTKKNISKKVLNQEIIAKTFNSSEIFNNSAFIKSNKNFNNESSSIKSSLSNSLINNFNNSVMSINNNVLSKNFQSPIKSNISQFLTNMNDEQKDKINMVKFLSIPRILHLFFLNKEYKYVCLLCPSNICYIKGIESYIFKFLDIKSYKFMGGFDLIKVRLCSINKKNPNNFFIETFDGKVHRNYEFIANSKENALYYAKAINYLAQLEKCKIYNNKNILQ